MVFGKKRYSHDDGEDDEHFDEEESVVPPPPPEESSYAGTADGQMSMNDAPLEELEITTTRTLKRIDEREQKEARMVARKKFCAEKKNYIIAAVVLLLVAVAIALGVTLGSKGGGSSGGVDQLNQGLMNTPDDFPGPDEFPGPSIASSSNTAATPETPDIATETSGGGNDNAVEVTTSSQTKSPTKGPTVSSAEAPTSVPPPPAPTYAPLPPTSAPVIAAPPICPVTTTQFSSHDENEVLTLERDGKPDRYFRIYTPENYDSSQPSKIVFMFHGWTEGTYCEGRIFLRSDWRDIADEHNYVLVGVDGLADNDSDHPRSFTFPGSSDGVGRDGYSITTCNVNRGPDHCYPSCERLEGGCENRCGFTHCRDDDIQMFFDLVDEVADKYVCVDRSRVYVYGYSMGGMFSWSLGQDPRTSPKIAGIGAAMGLPMHDHLVGKGDSSDLPAIGIYGNRDCSVPPGDGSSVFNEVCDDDGYYYVDAFHQHKLWASDHGCVVGSSHPARYEYIIPGRSEVDCSTHCDPGDGPPPSVDCRNNAEHGKEPWHLDVVLKFFEDHYLYRSVSK